MDLVALRTFATVARQGGVTGAARALNTVQSNVTQRIRALEAELGLELFSRHARGMELTRAGQRLLPYVHRILSLVGEARSAAAGDDAAAAPLTIGSMETTAALRLPKLLATYRKCQPGAGLSLETGPTAALIAAVLERRLDGAFVAGPVNNALLEATPAFEEELVLVSSARWKSVQEIGQRLQQGAAAIMFRSGCAYRLKFEQVLSEQGWPYYTRMEMGTVEGMLGCVAAETGVTLLPRAVVENAANRSQLRSHMPGRIALRVQTVFITRKDEAPSQALRLLLGLL